MAFELKEKGNQLFKEGDYTHNSLTPGGSAERATITDLSTQVLMYIYRISLKPIHRSFQYMSSQLSIS